MKTKLKMYFSLMSLLICCSCGNNAGSTITPTATPTAEEPSNVPDESSNNEATNEENDVTITPLVNTKTIVMGGNTLSLIDNLSCGQKFNFATSDPFSFSIWLKFTGDVATDNNYYGIFGNYYDASDNFRGYQVLLNGSYGGFGVPGGIVFYLGRFTGAWSYIDVRSDITFPLNTWVHLALTYDGSGSEAGVKIYINGVDHTDTVGATKVGAGVFDIQNNSNNFSIGNGGPAESNISWIGEMDEVSVWSTILSDTDISVIYNSGTATNLLDHSQKAYLKSWWRMGDGDGTTSDTLPVITDVKGYANCDSTGSNTTTILSNE